MRIVGPEAVGRLLVSRLAAERGFGKPIPVQDLVEKLLPYHHVRTALGLTMKGEYDLAILQFLHTGEHLSVEPALAQAVERELGAPEPDLGFLADVGEASVEVRPEAWARWSGDAIPAARARDQRVLTREHAAERSRRPTEPESEPEGSLRDVGPGPEDADRRAAPSERCRHCQGVLPERSELQFCPYCGVGQTDPACAECGEQLERMWAYCPRCGKATET